MSTFREYLNEGSPEDKKRYDKEGKEFAKIFKTWGVVVEFYPKVGVVIYLEDSEEWYDLKKRFVYLTKNSYEGWTIDPADMEQLKKLSGKPGFDFSDKSAKEVEKSEEIVVIKNFDLEP